MLYIALLSRLLYRIGSKQNKLLRLFKHSGDPFIKRNDKYNNASKFSNINSETELPNFTDHENTTQAQSTMVSDIKIY